MKKISFLKMSGSGNDFVLVDNRKKNFPTAVSAAARKLCDRHEGVGGDGLLLLEKSVRADFRMVYYNADGSRASMCGNGARCMAWFAKHQRAAGSHSQFETDAGRVDAKIAGDVVEITMGEANDYRPQMVLRVPGGTFPVAFVNTGVPHAVCFVPRVDAVDVQAVGRQLRYHKAFGLKGANVNFVQRLNSRTLKVRTYERGVEGETLACGTGVCASAIASVLKGWTQAPVRCLTAGGDTLQVNFELDPANTRRPARTVSLRGPVRVTFQGQTEI